MSFVPGWGGISPGAGSGIVPASGFSLGAWGAAVAGKFGGGGALGEYGYSMPSFQGETSVFKVDKPPTQGVNPTMPGQFTTKDYVDKNITYVHSAAPTDSPAEGTLRTSSISGTYQVEVYLNGGWRSGTLT